MIPLAGGRSAHVSATWSAIWSPATAFWGEIRKGTRAFQHSDFNANKRRAKDLLTLHVCPFIFLNRTGVCLATFVFSGACGLVGVGLGQKENRKILRESTGCDRKLSW